MKTTLFSYCQSHIEGNKKCKVQCDHCKEYYKPLEDKDPLPLMPIIKSSEGLIPTMEKLKSQEHLWNTCFEDIIAEEIKQKQIQEQEAYESILKHGAY